MLWQRPASLFWFVECIQIFNLKWSWYIPFTCAMEGKQDIEHLEVLTSTTPDLVEHVLFIGEKKSKFWVIVHDFWAFWSPGGTPYPSPDTLWMIIFFFETLNHVCTKEKFDSMYGWYGSNGHYIFCDFWWFFGPMESRWDPYPSPGTLWMIILSLGHSIMYVPKRNLI